MGAKVKGVYGCQIKWAFMGVVGCSVYSVSRLEFHKSFTPFNSFSKIVHVAIFKRNNVFPRLSACTQMTALSRRSAGPKEDVMIICLINNESPLSSGCQTSAGAYCIFVL